MPTESELGAIRERMHLRHLEQKKAVLQRMKSKHGGAFYRKARVVMGTLDADSEDNDRSRNLRLVHRLNPFSRGPVVDATKYDVGVLTNWSIFLLRGAKTQWGKISSYMVILHLLCVSLMVAAATVAMVPNPALMKTSKFHKISEFLRIFVGLLLGFFMSTCVHRWYGATEGLLGLFHAIRNLQMQLIALGVRRELRHKIIRYGVVSGWLLDILTTVEMLPPEDQDVASEDMWKLFEPLDDATDIEQLSGEDPMTYRMMSAKEISILKTVDDPAALVWVWIGSLLARLAQDGQVPRPETPTFCGLMGLVKDGVEAIRQVRQSVIIQAPFIYVHTLACLVHFNNFFSAVGFGIITGSTLSGYVRLSQGERDLIKDTENLLISFVVSIVGPFLYQSLLEVCICIALPFNSQEGQIPTEKLLKELQSDLIDAARVGTKAVSWEAPHFQGPAAPAVPPTSAAAPAAPSGSTAAAAAPSTSAAVVSSLG